MGPRQESHRAQAKEVPVGNPRFGPPVMGPRQESHRAQAKEVPVGNPRFGPPVMGPGGIKPPPPGLEPSRLSLSDGPG